MITNRVNQQLAGARGNLHDHIIAQKKGGLTLIVSHNDTQPKPAQTKHARLKTNGIGSKQKNA